MNFSSLRSKPDGIVDEIHGDIQTTIIEKIGSELRLKLISAGSNEWQSRIDLDHPYKLLCPYAYGALLSLLWNSRPSRVHVLGLGGGNLPTFLRSRFPDLMIDCTEIDTNVFELAKTYFGFQEDSRLRVFICDGREYLAARSQSEPYDIIFLDAFSGVGFAPPRLATIEFLNICQSQLSADGVLVMNLLASDPSISARVATFYSLFPGTYLCRDSGTVVFGTNAERVSDEHLIERAHLLQTRYGFDFPFIQLAQSLVNDSPVLTSWAHRKHGPLLTDALAAALKLPIPIDLIGNLDGQLPCPCGSGLALERCHRMNGQPGEHA